MWAISNRPSLVMTAVLFAATSSAGSPNQTGGSGQGELLIFGSVDTVLLDSDDPTYDTNDLAVAFDVLGSWATGRFRVLGEWLLSTEEQELEQFLFADRAQLDLADHREARRLCNDDFAARILVYTAAKRFLLDCHEAHAALKCRESRRKS